MTLVDLNVEELGWNAFPLADLAEQSASAALGARGLRADGFEISLLACDDARIADLNRQFRGKPLATNVLSWPAFELAPETPGAPPLLPPTGPTEGRILLGDVAIALQTVSAEADAAGIPLKNHVLHLILHGCLHLLGYDHVTDADAEVMETIERRVLTSLDVPDPYDDRRGGIAAV